MSNRWKITAIIFIILFAFETSVFLWAIRESYMDDSREYDCAYNVCADYPSYFYHWDYDMCQCHEGDEVVITKYLGK